MKHAPDWYSWENIISTAKTRDEAASLYAYVRKHEPETNWTAINTAIINRWSLSGLEYIKKLAWKMSPR